MQKMSIRKVSNSSMFLKASIGVPPFRNILFFTKWEGWKVWNCSHALIIDDFLIRTCKNHLHFQFDIHWKEICNVYYWQYICCLQSRVSRMSICNPSPYYKLWIHQLQHFLSIQQNNDKKVKEIYYSQIYKLFQEFLNIIWYKTEKLVLKVHDKVLYLYRFPKAFNTIETIHINYQ